MSAPIFGYRNFVDLSGTTLSGGDWRSSLPLSNIADRRLAKVARSVTDATADTQFDIDLGAARTVRALSLNAFNLSLSGTIRLRGYTGAGHTSEVYDSTALNPYEVYPSGVLQAGHPAFGGTTLAQEDLDDGYPVDFYHVLSTATSARYWWVTIDDTTNPDTYVDIGRCWLTYGYLATHGLRTGARLGWSTDSVKGKTRGGATIFDERPRRRRYDFTLGQFSEDESLVYLHEIGRYVGTTQQMMFIADDADTVHMHRRAMLCTIERLNQLNFSRSQWNDQAFSLVEDI